MTLNSPSATIVYGEDSSKERDSHHMSLNTGRAIEALRAAILVFGEEHPNAIFRFSKGHRFINQGEVSDGCFLVKDGVVSVSVRSPDSKRDVEVAVRVGGDLIGENAFLLRNAPRTASVEVVSPSATLIRLGKIDVFTLIRKDPALHNAISLLWELAASRRSETLQLLEGEIAVENKVVSVVLADIHNFSSLGEAAWEEQSNSFLFDFIENSEKVANQFGGSFEDQGDGYKILFSIPDHGRRALDCALAIKGTFLEARDEWIQRNDAFANIGLGIGICSDCMSIRRREASSKSRVLSHSINIAAAMSKYRAASSDTEVYIDDNTYLLVNGSEHVFDGPQQKFLEKLGRMCSVYCVRTSTIKETVSISLEESDGSRSTLVSRVTGEKLDSPVAVLFLASDPTDAARLRLAEEAREIQEKLQLSKYRSKFIFHQRTAARPEDISQALLDVEPFIVHFSGHGTSLGGLCFEDKVGKTHTVSPGSLAALFREFSGTVKCVILNACYSEMQARAICDHIDHVIGMDKSISDGAAIAFAVGLYQAVGAGKAFDVAFRLGCVQIGLRSDQSEVQTPILKSRTQRV